MAPPNYPVRVSSVSVYLPDDYPDLKHHAFPCSLFIFVHFYFSFGIGIRKGVVEYKALAPVPYLRAEVRVEVCVTVPTVLVADICCNPSLSRCRTKIQHGVVGFRRKMRGV